jgi:hypothetical protein
MDAFLPVCTDCYRERVRELRQQVALLKRQCRLGGLSEELEDLMNQQVRHLHAAIWALHAELESD